MTPDVTHVCALPEYDLLVSFEDGEWRRFSVKPYLQFPAYQALKEPTRFMAAHVLNGTVAWPGDIDISPDTLYITGVRVPPENS